MSYAESLDQAVSNVKQQTVLMQRCLSQRKLMDALKHTSLLLTELRNPALSPKQYYELYILAYDSLSILSNYLCENHPKRHHLADLYELVQYAGNVLPRLYLMITVGSSYLHSADSPREEILKDMIEMCRAVQNPIRGLFLRYYLSQRTKQFLDAPVSEHDKKFNINFIIENFIEMNKLWVRLQHQGPLKERDQRTRERKELQILIGANLVRLSQIVENDFPLYSTELLPRVLEQVVQCRDVVSQDYLLDVICQVFPDEFHLGTLRSLLDCTLKLNPSVPINKVVLNLVQRLVAYIDRQDEERVEERKTDICGKLASLGISDESPKNLFFIFWKYLEKLNEERPDLSLEEFAPLIQGIMNLSLRWYPDNFANVDLLYKFTWEKVREHGAIPEGCEYLFQDILMLDASVPGVDGSPASFLYKVLVQCESYQKLLSLQSVALQKKTVNGILDGLLVSHTKITSKLELEKLLAICEPLIKINSGNTGPAAAAAASVATVAPGSALAATPASNVPSSANAALFFDDEMALDAEDSMQILDSEQEKLAKLAHICHHRSIESHAELLQSCKSWFRNGGKNIRFTYPAIVTSYWRLIRRSSLRLKKHPAKAQKYQNLIKQLFKYVSRCNNDLFNTCGPATADLIYKLNLQTAALADQLFLGEVAYDFFSQAFTVFEESLSDSKTQFQAIVNMAQVLQKTRSLYDDSYYDTLITRCTLHGSKLLKKQDQCRAVYLCSHLWWATELSLMGGDEDEDERENENENENENQNKNQNESGGVGASQNRTHLQLFREGRRVLECLQRSLRVADSVMDNVQSCQLMVEILNQCCYYFVHGEEQATHVGVNYINGLIELIKTNLKSLKLEETGVGAAGAAASDNDNNDDAARLPETYVISIDGSYIHLTDSSSAAVATVTTKLPTTEISRLISVPTQYFQRTLQYLREQRQVDDRFKAIVL